MSRLLNSRVICGSAGMIALGLLSRASATNLLLNPGFEAPPSTQNPDTVATGWTFIFDAQRANYKDHTTGSGESIWMKTFINPVLGQDGVYQNVNNIVPGSNYSLSAFTFFEAGYSGSGATIQLGMIWEDSGGSPVGTPAALNIDPTSNPSTGAWVSQSVSGIAPVGATQLMVSLGWQGGHTSAQQPQSVFFDDIDLEGAGVAPTGDEWVSDASGDWNLSANWSSGNVPNGIGGSANLLGKITKDHTVFTDTAITLGTLNFDNAHTYVVTGAGSLTMQVSSGNAQINVNQGTQKLNLPTVIASNTVLNVNAGANLIIADPITINSGKTLTQSGAGSVTYQSIVSVLGSAGVAFANTTHAHELDIAAGGTASIGGSATTLTVDSLSNGGKVDVKNNKLIIAYGNGANPSSTVQSQLTSGYNGGAWNGNGINSSLATSKIGVGWKDDSVNKAVTVKYTYYGDANLDGSVNTSDFTAMSQHFGAASATANWANGDFNYDGKVNALDFNAISTNFGAAAIPETSLGSVVPEPGTLAVTALCGLLAARRRRILA